jgi:hypothetical protein
MSTHNRYIPRHSQSVQNARNALVRHRMPLKLRVQEQLARVVDRVPSQGSMVGGMVIAAFAGSIFQPAPSAEESNRLATMDEARHTIATQRIAGCGAIRLTTLASGWGNVRRLTTKLEWGPTSNPVAEDYEAQHPELKVTSNPLIRIVRSDSAGRKLATEQTLPTSIKDDKNALPAYFETVTPDKVGKAAEVVVYLQTTVHGPDGRTEVGEQACAGLGYGDAAHWRVLSADEFSSLPSSQPSLPVAPPEV